MLCLTADDTTSVAIRPLCVGPVNLCSNCMSMEKSNTHFGLKGTHLNGMECIYSGGSLPLLECFSFPSNGRTAFRFIPMKIIKISILCCDLLSSLTTTDFFFFFKCLFRNVMRGADSWLCNYALAALTN